MMKKLAFYLISAIATCDAQSPKKLSPENIFKTSYRSIVYILSRNSDGSTLQGSGVAFDDEIVVTNKHVIEDAVEITVSSGNKYWIVTEISKSQGFDLSFLKIKDFDLPVIAQKWKRKPAIGSTVYAIGNPKGLEATFSNGIIAGYREFSGNIYYQITAPISPGSSGGGLIDQFGDLIGVTTFKLKDGENLNFAIPVEIINKEFKNADFHQILKINKNKIKPIDPIKSGFDAIARKDPDTAISIFTKIYENDKSNSHVRIALSFAHSVKAAILTDASFLYDAKNHLKTSIELDPNNAHAWRILGIVHMKDNKNYDAISAFKKAIEIDPKDRTALYNLGICYAVENDIDNARKIYRNLIDVDKSLAEMLWNKAIWPLVRP